MRESNKSASWKKVEVGCSVVGQVWKDVGGNQNETLSTELAGYKIEVKERIEIRVGQRLCSAKKQGEGRGILRDRDAGGVKRKNRNENVLARPNGLRENAETAISCRGPGPARKKKELCQ